MKYLKILTLIVFIINLSMLNNKSSVQAAPTAGIISGQAFRDYDANGVQNGDEPGLAGVNVFVVDNLGNTDTATTAADGTYTLASLAGDQARVEFTLPASLNFLKAGAAGETTVQFIDISSGNVANVNAGFNNPAHYVDSTPQLASNLYTNGNATGTDGMLVAWDYALRGDATPATEVAQRGQIGATWGLAYNREDGNLYTAAFLKRHSGLANGLGSIMVTDPLAAANGTEFVDLAAAPFNVNFGSVPTDANRGLPASVEIASHDTQAFFQVGKVGIGNMDINDADSSLWFTNLFEKTLLALTIDSDNNPATSPTAADLRSFDIPVDMCNSYSAIYINAGGTEHTAVNDAIWANDGDGYFVGGTAGASGGATAPYNTERTDNTPFDYTVPVPDGTYSVTLHAYGTARNFNVAIEGVTQLLTLPNNSDYNETRNVTVTDGVLSIAFTNGSGNPTISGIHIVPTAGQTFDEAQPFAVKYHDGDAYVGVVCTAEYSQDATDLNAFVYRLSDETLPFEQILTFPLTYIKGEASNITACSADIDGYGEWHPFALSFPAQCTTENGNRTIWPQPFLSDIEFDVDDSMILGMMDRFGHQGGMNNYTLSGTETRRVVIGGDILRAYNNSGTYELEANGVAGDRTAAWQTSSQGVGNGEGPGGGEFYQDDASPERSHEETSLGGLTFWHTSGEVVSTEMDPLTHAESGGVLFYNNSTGSSTIGTDEDILDGYEVYETIAWERDTFGKANGLGDVEIISDAAPLEIGNRVWGDTDGDGIQDPDETWARKCYGNASRHGCWRSIGRHVYNDC